MVPEIRLEFRACWGSQLLSGALFPVFLVAAPLRMVQAPKRASIFFSRVTEQLRDMPVGSKPMTPFRGR